MNTRMVYLLPVESEPVPVGACAGNPQDISKLESQADERWGTCAMSTALPLSVYQSPLSNCWTTHRLTRSHDNNTTKAFFWHISNILIGLIKLCNDNTFTFFTIHCVYRIFGSSRFRVRPLIRACCFISMYLVVRRTEVIMRFPLFVVLLPCKMYSLNQRSWVRLLNFFS